MSAHRARRPLRRCALLAAALAAPLAGAEPVVSLWPSGSPGEQSAQVELSVVERAAPGDISDRFATGITDPTLTVFEAREPDGSALLIVPGGGYSRVVMDKEGYESARWFAARGTTSFVLLYRLPGEGWSDGADVVLQDTQRALRVIRSRADAYGIRPGRVGVIGFSAGGHAAAMLATNYDRGVYPKVDAADRLSARPDFAVLMYPVIALEGRIAHARSAQQLLGAAPQRGAIDAQSPHRHVSPHTPPTFLLHAADDQAVPLDNSLLMFEALRDAGVPNELHIFNAGGHGFGLRGTSGLPVAAWPELVHTWMQELPEISRANN